MAKQKVSFISLELEAFQKKIKEFQAYLNKNPIDKIYESKERHSEIEIQIKLMSSLGSLLGQLEALREKEDKQKESRGGTEINGLHKSVLKDDD